MTITPEDKIAFMACVEVALMRRGNVDYNSVICKLDVQYSCTIPDCYDYPERLRTVLKEVYKNEYDSVLEEIQWELEKLVDVDPERDHFLKMLRY